MMTALSGTIYTGVTNSVRRRSWEHKIGEGSAFTSKYEVDRLVYYERLQRFGNAIRREKQIKGWSRAKKIALIESMNPSWRDLSKDLKTSSTPIIFGTIGIPRRVLPSAPKQRTLVRKHAHRNDAKTKNCRLTSAALPWPALPALTLLDDAARSATPTW